MPLLPIQQNQSTYPCVFGPIILSSDHISNGIGLTLTVAISKNGGGFLTPAGAVSEVGNGMYKIAGNATDSNTLGCFAVFASGSTCDPYNDATAVVAYNPYSATNLGLSALPTANPAANNGLPTCDASNQVLANLNSILATVLTETSGQLTGAFKKFFNVAGPTLTCLDVNQTGDNYARLGAPAGASIAADIAQVETHAANVDTQVGTAGVGLTNVGGHPQTGDSYARIGANGASLTALATPTNITAGTITTVTNLTNAPIAGDLTATMKTSLNNSTPASVGNVTGNVSGSIVGDIYGNLEGDIGGIVGVTLPSTIPSLAQIEAGLPTDASITIDVETALTAQGYTTSRASKLDDLDTTVSSRSTYAGTDTAGTTTLLTRIPGTVQPQSGDSYSRIGPYGSGLTSLMSSGGVFSFIEDHPDGMVYFDSNIGTSGQVLGTNGTLTNPSNNWNDALVLCIALNIRTLFVNLGSLLVIGANSSHYNLFIIGPNSANAASIDLNGQLGTIDYYNISNLLIGNSGSPIDKSPGTLTNCSLSYGTWTPNIAISCGIYTITLSSSSIVNDVLLVSCFGDTSGGLPPKLNYAGNIAKVWLSNWSGEITLLNMPTSAICKIYGVGSITIDSTCTGGIIYYSGPIQIVNNSSSVVIINLDTSNADPWSIPLPGAYIAGEAGYILGTNLDTNVGSRMVSGATVSSVASPVTVGVNNDKTGYALTTAEHTHIAQDVLNATASSYNTPGTIGHDIGAAGTASDPWSTDLPGAYPSGSAGYIIGNSNSESGGESFLVTTTLTIGPYLTRPNGIGNTNAVPNVLVDIYTGAVPSASGGTYTVITNNSGLAAIDFSQFIDTGVPWYARGIYEPGAWDSTQPNYSYVLIQRIL